LIIKAAKTRSALRRTKKGSGSLLLPGSADPS
jgi:hypothetical protein